MEVAVLKRLQNSSTHICEFVGCGRNNKVNYVVMTLLGPNLSELRKHQPNQKFTVSTTLRVGVQIISAVQAMHDCGFLHRDIKPSNFSIGDTPETSRMCFMLDYGLARQYTTVTGEVRQPRPVAGFRGTVRYASLNAHLSRDLGRHDDLWSVFYLLVELAMGHLPWRRIRDKEEAGEVKAKYDHMKLIRTLPNELLVFLEHLKSSSYFDKPDYQLVTGCIQDAINRLGIQEADPYDWEQDFSAPSVTTASIVSPPAVKLVNEDAQSPMKTLQTSKTNCSAVGDLSENGHSEPKKNERHLNLTVPLSYVKRLPRQSGNKNDSKSNVIDTGSNSESNPSKPNQAPQPVLLGKDISLECVPPRDLNIENRYVSEEEGGEREEYGDALSSSEQQCPSPRPHHQEPSGEVPMGGRDQQQHHMHVGNTCEGVAPVKSYQTESLNRFYDYGGNAARESIVSYKSFSKKSTNGEQPHRESHHSSQYFSKTSDSSRSSRETDILNNAIIYPEKVDYGDLVNAFELPKGGNPLPAIKVQEPKPEDTKESCSSEQQVKSTTASLEEESSQEESSGESPEQHGDKHKEESSADSPESEDTDQSSEKSTKALLMHKLLMKSSSSQSESTKSIELLFARKTQNMDFASQFLSGKNHHREGESSRRGRNGSGKGIPAQKTSPELHTGSDNAQDSANTKAVDTNSPLQLSVSEHTGKANTVQTQAALEKQTFATNMSNRRKTKSESNFLEVLPQPVRIHPRPPPNPPPLNYSVSLLARRRRFVRTKANSKKS